MTLERPVGRKKRKISKEVNDPCGEHSIRRHPPLFCPFFVLFGNSPKDLNGRHGQRGNDEGAERNERSRKK
jgi:hypothetical protein